jgi:hypothetical protein
MSCLRMAVALGSGALAWTAGAQTGAYRAPADTVYLITSNPHRLYWVTGRDTVGDMVPSVTVSTQLWRRAPGSRAGASFTVLTRQRDLNVMRGERVDSLLVDAAGRVTVPAGPPAAHAVDFTVHLPAGAPVLAVGMTWRDTTASRETGSLGPDFPRRGFRVFRTLQVKRVFDTLGTRVAEIDSQGDVHYGDSWWADSTDRPYGWMDVDGPTHEVYWFDVNGGRLIGRRWRMDLRGRGGRPTRTGADTTPAGLIALENERVIAAETARLLRRAMPGRDTSVGFQTHHGQPVALIFLQTERVDTTGGAVTIESGFCRNDGMVGTALATFRSGRLQRYDAMWTDSLARPIRQSVVVRGDSLALHATGALDTLPVPPVDKMISAPRQSWAVADYAMDELLVPMLRTFGQDTIPHAIVVFRPTPRRWDTLQVQVKRLGAGARAPLLAQLRGSARDGTVGMIISEDGTLLYSDDTREYGFRRVPRGDSHRTGELQAILQTLQRPTPVKNQS